MRLRDYLHKHRLTQAAFGRLLTPSVSQGKVNHWINGTRRVSLSEALQVEAVTGGEVRPQDLVIDGSSVSRQEDGEGAASHGGQCRPAEPLNTTQQSCGGL